MITGEARESAAEFCSQVRALEPSSQGKPRCVICGGETTVTLGKTHGRGGRNQEFALACAFSIQETDTFVVASCGTDGNDGPTDAAGAVVDNTTIIRARGKGLDPRAALDNHDAYPLFEKLEDLVVTGPTGTNVMDIQIALLNE
jgi:hydroxypyruvate reductase